MNMVASSSPESICLTISPDAAGIRLDRALAMVLTKLPAGEDVPALSRSQIRDLILTGSITQIAEPVAPVRVTQPAVAGQVFQVRLPAPPPTSLEAELVALHILYEDDDVLVVNKPPGMVVHPAPTVLTGTLVNALLAHCGPALSTIGHPWRPGIVHRIDRGTSGILVVAKSNLAHTGLAKQFAEHTVGREYVAIVRGAPQRANPAVTNTPGVSFHAQGWLRIAASIGVDPAARTRMAVVSRGGRPAITHLRVESVTGPPATPVLALIRCRLETGRTHQIRVHLAHLGHPLVGDTTYGRHQPISPNMLPPNALELVARFARPALHAMSLTFTHPKNGERMAFHVPPPADFLELAEAIGLTMPLPESSTIG